MVHLKVKRRNEMKQRKPLSDYMVSRSRIELDTYQVQIQGVPSMITCSLACTVFSLATTGLCLNYRNINTGD